MQNTFHWLWLAIVIPVDGDIARAHGDAAAWLILAVRRRRVRVYVLVTAALGPEGGRGVVDMLCDARGQRALERGASWSVDYLKYRDVKPIFRTAF